VQTCPVSGSQSGARHSAFVHFPQFAGNGNCSITLGVQNSEALGVRINSYRYQRRMPELHHGHCMSQLDARSFSDDSRRSMIPSMGPPTPKTHAHTATHLFHFMLCNPRKQHCCLSVNGPQWTASSAHAYSSTAFLNFAWAAILLRLAKNLHECPRPSVRPA
jgi:hypothetical protein